MENREWLILYRKEVPEFLRQVDSFTGEDVRDYMVSRNLPSPSIPSLWSSAFQHHIVRSGFVIRSGKTQVSTLPQQKSTRKVEWRSLLGPGTNVVTPIEELQLIAAKFKCREITLMEALKLAVRVGAESVQ